MLHILWLIVKFILILLGILLGLVLLLVLLVLFCPVSYRAHGYKGDGDWKKAEVWARVSWLFHGISVTVYRRDGTNGFSVKVLGISMEKVMSRFRHRKEKKSERKSRVETEKKIEGKNSEKEFPTEFETGGETVKEEIGKNDISKEENAKEDTVKVRSVKEKNSGGEFLSESAEEKTWQEDFTENKGLFRRISEKLSEIRIKTESIKAAFHNSRNKIEWMNSYIHHPKVKAAASLVWKNAKGLLKHILPTKVWGNVTFGFSDPSITGQVLGLLGMSFPLHKNCVAVTPIFGGETVLEGEINLKGRIYGIVPVKAAIVIYFNKNVKYAVKRAKHRKHKED